MDLNEVWITLEQGAKQIFKREPKLTIKQFADLNRLVFDYCTNIKTILRERERGEKEGAFVLGEELYKRIKNFLENYLVDLSKSGSNLKDEELLEFYAIKWTEYQSSSRVLNGVFRYINQKWVRREIVECHENVYTIYDLALITWREHIFKVMRSYDELRVLNASGQNLYVYKENFDEKFLADAECFFLANCTDCVQQNSVQTYLEHVEQLLNEKLKGAQVYLLEKTIASISKICERILIEKYLDLLRTEFQNLLESEQNAVLGRMYSMTLHFKNASEELASIFEEHIHKKGLETIAQCGDAAKNDSKVFVKAVLKVHEKYNAIVSIIFKNDAAFVAAFDKACNKFINTNVVTTSNKNTNQSSELLAKYCNLLLKNPDEADLDDVLNQAVAIFKYIDDKDVFQKFYSKMLAKRLINHTSASDSAEASMISKLTQVCGNDYTYKLNRMVQDIVISRDLNDEYRRHAKASKVSNGIDFSVQVLSSSSWSLSKSFSFSLPSELEKPVQCFNEFYGDSHSGRKLIWLYNICKGEIMTNCFKNQYTLQASTFQMAVLLQFNEQTSFTVQQLDKNTGMPQEKLLQVLQTLLNVKLLTCSDKECSLTGESIIELSSAYENKKRRININIPLKTELKIEQEVTEEQIEEDRKFLIQAAIVHIMKEHKALNHQNLIAKVLTQLAKLFKPKIPVIKKCISLLIENEYLERKEGQEDTYEYLA